MAFTRTWDAAYEALPTNANYGYEIDDFIRQCRVDVRERMEIGHSFAGDDSDGKHILSDFQGSQYAANSAVNDTYVVTLAPIPAAYFNGMVVNFFTSVANTGACTLNVNGLGAKSIYKVENAVNQELLTGDILANQMVTVIYYGGSFKLLTPTSQTRVKNGSGTKDMSDDDGDTTITGCGFMPRLVILNVGIVSPAIWCRGEGGYGLSNGSCLYKKEDGTIFVGGTAIRIEFTSGDVQAADIVCSSSARDGFIIRWTKTGTPTGTLTYSWTAVQ